MKSDIFSLYYTESHLSKRALENMIYDKWGEIIYMNRFPLWTGLGAEYFWVVGSDNQGNDDEENGSKKKVSDYMSLDFQLIFIWLQLYNFN